MKKALITGATGQDGAYLTKLLLEKGYKVHGVKRRSSSLNTQRVDNFYEGPHLVDRRYVLHYGDLTDSTNIIRIIQEVQPDEIYNLGAMSHVKVSFEMPEYTADVNGLGTLRILEAVRLLGMTEKVKIYQASTSELYGEVQEIPQTEKTPFYPRSPYGVAKLYAYWITVNYREAYNMFACNGILFNHESPLRGETFVTRKITRAVAKIGLNLQEKLYIGNLNAKRDWGHAKDYVELMWRILQHDTAEDWVIATGKTTSVRDFIKFSFSEIGIQLKFEGEGSEEVGKIESIDQALFFEKTGKTPHLQTNQLLIEVNPRYFRPTEVDLLVGDATKAREKLNWKPKYSLAELCSEMVSSDLEFFKKSVLLREAGYDIGKEIQD